MNTPLDRSKWTPRHHTCTTSYSEGLSISDVLLPQPEGGGGTGCRMLHLVAAVRVFVRTCATSGRCLIVVSSPNKEYLLEGHVGTGSVSRVGISEKNFLATRLQSMKTSKKCRRSCVSKG